MLKQNASEELKNFSETAYPKKLIKITDRIYHAVGWGHSNSVIIIGDDSCILIDTLDTDARARRLREEIGRLTDKPVKTIIYTHGHPDHRGGAGAFKDTVEEIIAFAPQTPVLKYTDTIAPALNKRAARQFGYALTNEETITQGIGIREGWTVDDGVPSPLPPTTVYQEKLVERTISGVTLQLAAAPGETDDQIFVFFPEDKVLCCGDNYYGCWPNLYAIRGSQYRDIAAWVDSLKTIRSYEAEALLPGHTLPIIGTESVKEVLSSFLGAIESVLKQTLECICQGLTQDEAAQKVILPSEYQELPYMQEYYGTVQWSVRAIYQGYVGWFDGNPTNLNRLSPKKRGENFIALAGGPQKVLDTIKKALQNGEYQWGAELSDLLIDSGVSEEEACHLKAQCLFALSEMETSANGRHYYIACAKELENK